MSKRDLKAQTSNPSDKKVPRVEDEDAMEDGQDSEPEMDMREMMKMMMKDMKEVKTMMKSNSKELNEVKVEAQTASETAAKAIQTAEAVKEEVKTIREDLPKMISQAVNKERKEQTSVTKDSRGTGKGGGKAAKKIEERGRSLRFSNFPPDTKDTIIVEQIKEKLKDNSFEIEEIFSYGRYSNAGCARFASEDGMWSYLVENKGKSYFEFQAQKIYMRAEQAGGDEPKVKATRKVVRAVIEASGEDGHELKNSGKLYANYWTGVIIWDGVRIAEWQEEEQIMKFTETGAAFEQPFRRLMGN